MKAGFIYERLGFTEDGDPIHDMGIGGKLHLSEEWERIFASPMKEYKDFISQLIGKTLTGVFVFNPYQYTRDATVAFSTREPEPITITVADVRMFQSQNIVVTSTDGKEYVLEGDREYKIE